MVEQQAIIKWLQMFFIDYSKSRVMKAPLFDNILYIYTADMDSKSHFVTSSIITNEYGTIIGRDFLSNLIRTFSAAQRCDPIYRPSFNHL